MTNKQQKIGNPMKLFILSIILLLTNATAVQAEIKASVDRQEMYFGESLTLTITSDKNTSAQPDFTMLDAVFHVGQTGKSSSTQIINGSVSTKTTWQVLLVPKSMGSHIIPPIEVDGERTEAIKIEVKKPDPNAQAKGDIFIEIEANKNSAFVQEEILLTVRLLYAINLKNGALSEPGGDGVIVQQINKGTNYNTQRDGKTYQVLERKYAIFAENSGPLTLNPLVFEGEVTDNSRPSYSLFQRGRPIRQVSEMLELDIKQIPQEFIGKDWIPAKQVTLKQSWSQEKPYRVGEPITRTINLTAIGLSETQIPDISIDNLDGAKIYQDKTDTMTRTDGQQLIATKTIKYAVIPSESGELSIPELNVEWYDTASKTAKTATIPATSLSIKAADTSTTQAPQAVNFNPIEITETQAKPNTTETMVYSDGGLWKVLTLLFAALWLFTTVFLWSRLKNKSTPASKDPGPAKPHASLHKLNHSNPTEIQQTLINWWNQQHQQQTTNLGQIKQQLATGDMQQALEKLQRQLYYKQQQSLDVNWQQLIKQGHFKPASQSTTKATGLPELYATDK